MRRSGEVIHHQFYTWIRAEDPGIAWQPSLAIVRRDADAVSRSVGKRGVSGFLYEPRLANGLMSLEAHHRLHLHRLHYQSTGTNFWKL